MQYLRSLVFVGQMYLAMLVLGIVFAIPALVSRAGARAGVHTYCRWVLWTARVIARLRTEVRGTPPQGEALIASKHQSFLDIIMIVASVPRPRFIMKHTLMFAPILGLYALRIGCVPVVRGKRGQAIAKMLDDVASGRRNPGQMIIYPQGTRIAPGVDAPYKVGAALLYDQLGQTCYPAATNVGVFWPRKGIYRKPGTAVVEFLDPIPPGQDKQAFLSELEGRIEAASDRLLDEAGFRRGD